MCGAGAGAEDEAAGAVGRRRSRSATVLQLVALVVGDLGDRRREAHAAQPVRGPPAVVVVLDAQRVEVLPDVERVQPARSPSGS